MALPLTDLLAKSAEGSGQSGLYGTLRQILLTSQDDQQINNSVDDGDAIMHDDQNGKIKGDLGQN